MLNGRVRRVGGPHLPFRRVMLCLECEECFEIGPDACPQCGSETWIPVARLLERRHDSRGNSSRTTYIAVVARDRPVIYRDLAQLFAGDPTFEVVLDRRQGERRSTQRLQAKERRVADRRAYRPQAPLHPFGWIIARRSSKT